MTTIALNRLLVAGLCVTLLGTVRSSQASTITFDAAISTPNPGQPTSNPLGDIYQAPGPFPSIMLQTQGFVLGDNPNQFVVVHDPSVCLAGLGVACASDGTSYFEAGHAFTLARADFGPFSIASFDASQFLLGAGPITNATSLNVVGFRSGVQVALQPFGLGAGFASFALNNDPDWVNVDRVEFQPLAGAGPGAFALDNIVTANPVPEPASVALVATGLAGLAARRRRLR